VIKQGNEFQTAVSVLGLHGTATPANIASGGRRLENQEVGETVRPPRVGMDHPTRVRLRQKPESRTSTGLMIYRQRSDGLPFGSNDFRSGDVAEV
jgi:hypothetical protein